MDLQAEIRETIARILALDEQAIVPESHLQEDLAADSLALLNLAEALAERYGIEIGGDDLMALESVGAPRRRTDPKSGESLSVS